MNVLWEGVKATASIVGQAAVHTGKIGKLQTELLLMKREIENRKRTFGEDLYDYVEPLSKHPDFFASNDRLTDTLRGPLLTAQREISALYIKRGKLLEKVKANEETQKTAFAPAQNIGGHLVNGIKKTGFVSVSAKLKTEVSMVDTQIRDYKQVFGLEMFATFVDLEDIEGWLPTVRDIRNIYDQCRRDVDEMEKRRRAKEKELIDMGGTPMTQSSETSSKRFEEDDNDPTPRFFREAAAAEAESDAHYRRTATATASQPDPLFGSMGYGTGMPAQPSYPNPFTGTSAGNVIPMQQQNAINNSETAPINTSILSDPFPSAFTSATSLNNHTGQNGNNNSINNNLDPFLDDGFGGTTMGGTASTGSSFASSSVDPFSAFDSLQPPANSQQQSNINPMFRY